MERNAPAAERSGARRGPERRSCDRFPITEEVRYRVLDLPGSPIEGYGSTVNISSSGICLRCSPVPPPGFTLEVSVNWPVALNGACPLKLVAVGRVLRSAGGLVALRVLKYQFKTRSLRAGNRLPPVQGPQARPEVGYPAAK